MSRIRVLFVCLGNICRSPMAEGLFIQKTRQLGRETEFFIESAGTAAYHVGELPDPRMRETASQNGIQLVSRARQIQKEDLEEFDHILAMDRSNMENILSLAPLHSHKATVHLMRDFDILGKGEDVPDPYYGGQNGFLEVYEILNRSTDGFLEHINQTGRFT